MSSSSRTVAARVSAELTWVWPGAFSHPMAVTRDSDPGVPVTRAKRRAGASGCGQASSKVTVAPPKRGSLAGATATAAEASTTTGANGDNGGVGRAAGVVAAQPNAKKDERKTQRWWINEVS